MKIIEPSYEILTPTNGNEVLRTLEKVARTCYKSEEKIGEGTAEKMVANLIKNGHEAMIEFFDITVKFVHNRGFTHEMVRHRLCSFAQESTRYVSSINKASFTASNEEEILFLYSSGLTMKRIAEISNGKFTEWEVYKIIDNSDLVKRGHNRKGLLNENYFRTIDSAEKAYLLGIIQSDGSIRKDNKGFSISQCKDYSWYLQQLIKKEFYSEATRSKDKNCHSICLYSEVIVKNLISLGIIPNKAKDQKEEHIDTLWKSIPDELKPDFIRGVLDGDGWVTFFLQNEKTESCNVGWSGNKFLMQKISTWLKDNFNYEAKVKVSTGETYRLQITKPSKMREIIPILYRNFVFPYGHPNKTSKIWNFLNFTYREDFLGDEKFMIVRPYWQKSLSVSNWFWLEAMYTSENSYLELLRLGLPAQAARGVLPNDLKTEINVKANLREWRAIFKLRCAPAAHPDMRRVMIPLLQELKNRIPIIFDDIRP